MTPEVPKIQGFMRDSCPMAMRRCPLPPPVSSPAPHRPPSPQQHLVTSVITHRPHSYIASSCLLPGSRPKTRQACVGHARPTASAGFLSVGSKPAARSDDCFAGALPLPRAMWWCRRRARALCLTLACDEERPGARSFLSQNLLISGQLLLSYLRVRSDRRTSRGINPMNPP